MDDAPKSTLTTTAMSLSVIETLQELDGATMGQVAEELDIATSTAFKHLITLENQGYLLKEGQEYYPGLRFLNLGEYARSRRPERQLVEEAIEKLANRTEEEVDYIVQDHGRVITVSESYHKWAKYDEGDATYRARLGDYYRMHATATGKAILAEYPTEQVERIIDRWGLPARTENTITDRETVAEELETIRERGYAYDMEEFTEGLRSVGMVVRRPGTDRLASMSVSGPSYRLAGEVLREEIPSTMRDVVDGLEERIEALYTRS